jgi:hypothetical protein
MAPFSKCLLTGEFSVDLIFILNASVSASTLLRKQEVGKVSEPDIASRV